MDVIKLFRLSRFFKVQNFDFVGTFKGGFAIVRLNEKENFINENGKLLSPNQWFDYVGGFSVGFAHVRLNGKYNLINAEGKLLSDQWFDSVGSDFKYGFVRVRLGDKFNFIDRDGKLLSDHWFDKIFDFDFDTGYAFVKTEDGWRYIDTDGKLVISEQNNTKDMEENKEKKILYIVLVDKEYIDTFTNAEDALVCVLKNQEAGQISVIKKPI